MTHKQQAIDRTNPLATKPGRYRPPDSLLAFLEALYADLDKRDSLCHSHDHPEVGITRRSA